MNLIRKELLDLGWSSEDKLGTSGWPEFGYSITFSRWDWHGKFYGMPITFHSCTSDLTKVDACVEKAAALAKRAWVEFSDCIPVQYQNDELRKDDFLTDLWQRALTNEERQKKLSDKIPSDMFPEKIKIVPMHVCQRVDLVTIRDFKFKFNKNTHRYYLQSSQLELDQLVEQNLIQYTDLTTIGKCVLGLTYLGEQYIDEHIVRIGRS